MKAIRKYRLILSFVSYAISMLLVISIAFSTEAATGKDDKKLKEAGQDSIAPVLLMTSGQLGLFNPDHFSIYPIEPVVEDDKDIKPINGESKEEKKKEAVKPAIKGKTILLPDEFVLQEYKRG